MKRWMILEVHCEYFQTERPAGKTQVGDISEGPRVRGKKVEYDRDRVDD